MGCEVEAAQPGRGLAAARRTVSMLLLSIDRHAVAISGASRRDASRPRQSNDLDGRARCGPALADGGDRKLGEALGLEREVGFAGIGLDLDVEAHGWPGHGEQLFQRGETLAIGRLLLGELLGVCCWRGSCRPMS